MNVIRSTKMARILAGATAVLLLLGSLGARADVIYTYTGTCSFNCDVVGLPFGGADTLYGEIHVDEAAVASGIVTGSDINFYDFLFGTFAFNQSNSFVLGGALIDGLGFNTGLYVFRFQGIGLASNTGAFGGLEGWTARVGLRLAAGPGSYRQVSEPGTLMLLGLGLLGLGLTAKRKTIA